MRVPTDVPRSSAVVALPTPTGTAPTTSLTPLCRAREDGRTLAPGERLERLRAAVPELAADLVASGQPSGVTTADLVARMHRTSSALDDAVRTPVRHVWLTHRMLVVQWDDDGHTRTLLWNPDDATAPDTSARTTRQVGTVLGHVRALGIDPAHVDLLVHPDLRHRDVRRWLGTTRPAPDLGRPDAPQEAAFPNARLLVSRPEWDAVAHPHPLERAAYRSDAFRDLPADRVVLLDGDVVLGPGVALIGTPGRTPGAVSLLLHTDGGPWVVSANGVAAECWAPRASRLPGLRHHAVDRAREVVPHRTPGDDAMAHHDAMIVERLLATTRDDAPFPRCTPVAELTAHRRAPGLAPTGPPHRLTHGLVRGDRVLAARVGST